MKDSTTEWKGSSKRIRERRTNERGDKKTGSSKVCSRPKMKRASTKMYSLTIIEKQSSRLSNRDTSHSKLKARSNDQNHYFRFIFNLGLLSDT